MEPMKKPEPTKLIDHTTLLIEEQFSSFVEFRNIYSNELKENSFNNKAK